MSIIKRLKNKRIIKTFIAVAIIAILFAIGAFLKVAYVPAILMYHSVGKESTALDGYGPKLNVSTAAFERQMRFLKQHGYNVIPLAEFIQKIKQGEAILRKTVCITFDDGLKNNFVEAYPILKKYNLPATIFVSTDFIGKDKFLSWNEIKEMQKDIITIGSHTASHKWLPSLDGEALRRELVGSKRILEEITGEEVETLSYPLGGFDGRVKAAVKKAGYIGAVATNPGKDSADDDPYALKRVRISMTSNNLFVFWIETSGYYTFIKEVRDDD